MRHNAWFGLGLGGKILELSNNRMTALWGQEPQGLEQHTGVWVWLMHKSPALRCGVLGGRAMKCRAEEGSELTGVLH